MTDSLFDDFSLRALAGSLRAGISQSGFIGHVLLTLFVLALAAIGSRLITRYYRRTSTTGTTEARRMAYLASRNTLVGATALLLLFIWAGELRTFALSIAALAAAVAIVCKEFFMSGLGSLMRALTRPYVIGDVIEIAQMKGEVLEIDFLCTRLLEEGPSGYMTGRTFEFPNMMLLTHPVRRLSHTGRFVHELVRVPIDSERDVGAARDMLLQAGETVCAEWVEAADAHFRRIESAHLIALPDSRPVALIEPIDPKRVDVVLRFPCQAGRRVSTSQAILHTYYALVQSGAAPAPRTTEPAPIKA